MAGPCLARLQQSEHCPCTTIGQERGWVGKAVHAKAAAVRALPVHGSWAGKRVGCHQSWQPGARHTVGAGSMQPVPARSPECCQTQTAPAADKIAPILPGLPDYCGSDKQPASKTRQLKACTELMTYHFVCGTTHPDCCLVNTM